MHPLFLMKLTTKLALAILVAGMLPAAIISRLALQSAQEFSEATGDLYQEISEGISSKIDRSLFERYGDVQAFASNGDLQDLKSWYLPDSTKNKVAAAANRNLSLYGDYYLLMYMVDTTGRLVAVNDKTADGTPIDTAYLYQKDFKDAVWFKEVMAGNFTKGPNANGTYIQDVHVDDDVNQVFGGAGLTLGYSAPVKDPNGKVIGVWHNCANFGLVEEIVVSTYRHLAKRGLEESEITLLDKGGRIISSYDPVADSSEKVKHDMSVLLKANLVTMGNEAAAELSRGNSGHLVTLHVRKNVMQVTGFTQCGGALGAPTFKWGVLVRTPADRALAQPIEQRKQIIFYLSASAVGLLVLAVLLGSTIARALSRGINTLHQISGSMVSAAGQFSNSSQVVAQGSSEQAAALEETSASLEEIAAMTQRTSENANSGKALSKEARSSADVGLNWITQMSQTLVGIRSAVMEMESSVREMQGSSQEVANIINTIDEIAFQTNLLALNAAVEAARAGEAGMGFAVVADEVRALAQRSAQAAKETSQKIDSSLRLSEQSGTASGKVVKSLIEVESTAGNLQQVFEGIVKQITSLDDVINEMAGACGEQSTGIAQVNMSITQLDTVTQGNAAIAEENAGVASELNTHIQSLKGVVGDLQVVVTGKGTFSGATEAAMGSRVASAGKVSTVKTLTFPSSGSKQSGGPTKAPLGIPMPGDPGSAKNAELIAQSFKDF